MLLFILFSRSGLSLLFIILPDNIRNLSLYLTLNAEFYLKGIKELEGLEEKAKASGACQLVVKDLKEEFVKDYIFPCLRAGAIYERKYLLGTSMARPVIAKVNYVK